MDFCSSFFKTTQINKAINRQLRKKCNEAKEDWIDNYNQYKKMQAYVGLDCKTVQQKIKEVLGGGVNAKTGSLWARGGTF